MLIPHYHYVQCHHIDILSKLWLSCIAQCHSSFPTEDVSCVNVFDKSWLDGVRNYVAILCALQYILVTFVIRLISWASHASNKKSYYYTVLYKCTTRILVVDTNTTQSHQPFIIINSITLSLASLCHQRRSQEELLRRNFSRRPKVHFCSLGTAVVYFLQS